MLQNRRGRCCNTATVDVAKPHIRRFLISPLPSALSNKRYGVRESREPNLMLDRPPPSPAAARARARRARERQRVWQGPVAGGAARRRLEKMGFRPPAP